MSDPNATAAVPAQNLGQQGETLKTPPLVVFKGAAVTIWAVPKEEELDVFFKLSVDDPLLREFELVLTLGGARLWVVFVDASVQGVYPDQHIKVRLLHFNRDQVEVVAITGGQGTTGPSRGDVPEKVWAGFQRARDWYTYTPAGS